MFNLNKEARVFLQSKFNMIRNGFENEGLITYQISYSYESFDILEQLYFKVLKKNIENRILTIKLKSFFDWYCLKINEVLTFIKATCKHIKLQFKLNMALGGL